MWGWLSTCGRLSIGLPLDRGRPLASKRRVANPPLVEQPAPHGGRPQVDFVITAPRKYCLIEQMMDEME
jgi:hypothetical protein